MLQGNRARLGIFWRVPLSRNGTSVENACPTAVVSAGMGAERARSNAARDEARGEIPRLQGQRGGGESACRE